LILPDATPEAAQSDAAFAEPWQARAFAIAILACRQHCFTWSEWTRALSREMHRASDGDAPVAQAGYFDCWLAALQSLLVGKGAVGQDELCERKSAWEDAYHRTPHGATVGLSSR
jgi:nitrile hydratase accessory protein